MLAGLRDKPCGKGVLCQAGARLCPQWHVPGLPGITALFEHTLKDVKERRTGEAPQELNLNPDFSGQFLVAGKPSVNDGSGCLIQDEVRCLCRLAGCCKNCLFIVFQNFDPALHIISMGFNCRVDHAELPDCKCGPQFSDEFFKGIGIITESFPEASIQAGFTPRPVGQFMQSRGIKIRF